MSQADMASSIPKVSRSCSCRHRNDTENEPGNSAIASMAAATRRHPPRPLFLRRAAPHLHRSFMVLKSAKRCRFRKYQSSVGFRMAESCLANLGRLKKIRKCNEHGILGLNFGARLALASALAGRGLFLRHLAVADDRGADSTVKCGN